MDKMNKEGEVQQFNRYCDILPFEDTRVKLQVRDGPDPNIDHYVNANYISSTLSEKDTKFIAA